MKILKIWVLLLFFPLSIQAQRTQKVLIQQQQVFTYKWEGITAGGIRVCGVAKTYKEAKQAVDRFNTKNWNTKYKLEHHTIRLDTVIHIGDDDYFAVFKKRCPPGYRFFSPRDMAAIDIVDREGMNAAILYYLKTSNKGYKEAKNYLQHLYYNLNRYRIKEDLKTFSRISQF
ncbi:hypothetical protein [Aquimarina mytili]|uniref:Uncharacterized protein n=1 Tax=Aquimarina mytili TaxID=874423 RepID=A0A937A3B6_9FLAO|nr:hypothetical protein [Aquimarina mytili]MBL0686101.1 hypothetical protein [Aquimarina mytili]